MCLCVYLCMCVHMCLCVSVYVCMCMYVSIYIYIYVCACMSVCVSVCACISICMFACMPMCVSVCISMCVHVCMCVSICACVCIYVPVCVCVCVCTSLYIHVWEHLCMWRGQRRMSGVLSIALCFIPLRQGLSQDPRLWFSLGQEATPTFFSPLLPSTGVTELCDHTWLFSVVLRTRTQVLVVIRSVLAHRAIALTSLHFLVCTIFAELGVGGEWEKDYLVLSRRAWGF